jgi:RND family efflux transporter MFP subunit
VKTKRSTSAEIAAKPSSSPPDNRPVTKLTSDLQAVFAPTTEVTDLPRAPRKSRFRFYLLLLAGIAGLGLLAWGIYAWVSPDSNGGISITATVTRGDLPIVVTDRGELESSQSVSVRCEVEGRQHKIVDIVPNGTQVKKDQVVLKFDTEELTRRHAEQEVKLKGAEGKAKSTKEKLEQAKYKAEGDIAEAELAHELAVLECKKYLEGEFDAEVFDKEGAIALARRDLKDAEEKLVAYRKFVKSGFGTPEQLQLKEAEVEKSRFYLERDKKKLDVLKKYMFEQKKTELTAKAKEAERKLSRIKSSSAAAISEAQSEFDAADITARLEKSTLDQIKSMLQRCEVKAPQDGILEYANARYYDSSSRIAPGAMVWFQQPLFTIPDLGHMQVKVKIHEAMVKKVKAGLKAEIRVEAAHNKVLKGTIKSVATLADNPPWDERGIKEYPTIVTIDELPPGGELLPGMSAEVRIMVKTLDNVLMLPVQAVTEKGGTHYAYVVTSSGVERREIEVGDNNDKYVEVKSGIEEGAQVTMDARSRIVAEMGRNGQEEAITKKHEKDTKKEPPPAPPSAAPGK